VLRSVIITNNSIGLNFVSTTVRPRMPHTRAHKEPHNLLQMGVASTMISSIIVVDDFYTNAKEVREFILSQDFCVRGNYPGARTVSYANESIKWFLEQIVGRKITYWPREYNGSFQLTTESDVSWIHRDATQWAAVLFLTPDAPVDGGTAFFRHRETGLEECGPEIDAETAKKLDDDSYNADAWEIVDRIGNKFNRLVVFRGKRSHSSMCHFGTDKASGRLFQVFFFDTIN
jgi:hypothetical protein